MTAIFSYIISDIEADGPDAGVNSMLSFASVACDENGNELASFAINLQPLEHATTDPGTMAWWSGHPEQLAQATRDPIAPALAMRHWADWLRSQPGLPVFVAHPLSFDGAWLDYYAQRFLDQRLFARPRSPGLCHGAGIDLPSMVMAATGWSYGACIRDNYPDHWLGTFEHNHSAIDDARGYAHLFGLLRRGSITTA